MKQRERGFTILELLAVTAIIALVANAALLTTFHVLRNSDRNANQMTATSQVQNAGYWISLDAQKAQSVEAASANETVVTVSWDHSEGGTLEPDDKLYFSFSDDSGSTWSSNFIAFSDDIGATPEPFSYVIPNKYLTTDFKMRFFVAFDASERAYIDNITVANVTEELFCDDCGDMDNWVNGANWYPYYTSEWGWEFRGDGAGGGLWYNEDWQCRREITIDHTKVEDVASPETTYADFPVLVYATGLSGAKADGADIRFTESDGITELPREIESYSSGTLYAWVKVNLTKDSGDSEDDVIYMYYGNDAATEPDLDSPYGAQNVWETNYKGVWHLSEDPSGTVPPADWYDGEWECRREITIDHTKVEDVADPEATYDEFPVLVCATGLSGVKADGADIRFTESDGITELSREIESYADGTLYAWVKVTLTKDSSDSEDDLFYMYYSNDAATEPAPDSTYGAQNVWEANYKGVWHLSEDPTGPHGWYNQDWQYCKKITIDHDKVEADLTDFPVLVSITDSDLRDQAKSDGSDIVFTSSDGTTKLKREIESYDDSTGTLVAWVKTGLSGSSDTELYIYYGNSGASETNDTDTWDTSFKGVWHLQETTGGANAIEDSTSNSNHGTDQGSPTLGATGKVDGSVGFDGTNDFIDAGDPASGSLDFGTGAFTASAWIKTTATTGTGGSRDDIIAKGDPTSSGYAMNSQNNKATFMVGNNLELAGTTSINNGAWHYIVGTRLAGGTVYVYVDGVSENTGSNTESVSTATNFIFGKHGTKSESYFPGTIDEVRVSNTARSAEWIKTSHNNQNAPSNFYSLGTEQTTAAEEGIKDSTSNNNDGATGGAMTSGDQVAGQINGSLDFDGTDDYINIPRDSTLEPTTAVTASTWFYWHDNNASYYGKILAKTTSSDTAPWISYVLEQNAGNQQIVAAINVNGTGHSTSAQSLTENEWHHLVLTWSSGDNIRFYIDGTQATSTSSTYSGSINYYDVPFRIGFSSWGESDTQIDGVIDEVRVSNTARSAEWIKTSHTNQSVPSNFYSLGTEETAAAEEGIKDSTSNNNDGAACGDMSSGDQVAGKINGSLNFDGVDEYIDCDNDASLQITGTMTIEAWCKPDVTGTYAGIAGKLRYASGDYAGYALAKHDTNKFRFVVASSDTSEVIDSDSTYAETDWHHIVGVHRGTTFYLYVDGTEQTATGTRAIEESNQYFHIGRQYADYDDRWWYGKIDEVRISNTDRSAKWIKTEYNNHNDPANFCNLGTEETTSVEGGIKDSTSNNNDGTAGGAMTSGDQVAGQINGSLDFDGTDDRITIPNSSSLDVGSTLTAEAWVKWESGGTPGCYARILERKTNWQANNGWTINIESGDDNDLEILGSSSIVVQTHSIVPSWSAGGWHHIVVAFDGNTVYPYADGVAFSSGGITTVVDNDNNLLIGEYGGGGDNWNGKIDEVRISDITRSDVWIKTSYNNQSDPASFSNLGTEEAVEGWDPSDRYLTMKDSLDLSSYLTAGGFPLILTWTSWDSSGGTEHEAIYNIVGGVLRRSYSVDGGAPTITLIAKHIDAYNTICQFASGRLTLTVAATVGSGPTASNETREFQVLTMPD